jgi:fatty acid desaturase
MPARPDIEWRDLAACSRREIVTELALPLPWLAAALLAGAAGHAALVVAATFVMFMTGLRVTHNAFHRTLGLSERSGDVVMLVLSILLGGAMHAIEYTHLRHHRDCLAHDDVEGRIAALGFWRALLHSPTYPWHIHHTALRHGTRRQRRWIVLEIGLVAITHGAIWLASASATVRCIALALYFANASAAMVGIWAVHRGCGHGGPVARTSRSRWLDLLVFNMFHHLEHHQFPGVPTCHLPRLARRIDAVHAAPPLCLVSVW